MMRSTTLTAFAQGITLHERGESPRESDAGAPGIRWLRRPMPSLPVWLAPAEPADCVPMLGRVDAIFLRKPLDLGLAFFLRELGAQARDRCDEGRSGQDWIPAHRGSLLGSLLFGMTGLVLLQGTESPDGPVPQGLSGQAVLLGNLLQRLLDVLVREDGFSEFFDSGNERVHVTS